jgi:serine/threonine protein kinase
MRKFREPMAAHFVLQLANALSFCHEKLIIRFFYLNNFLYNVRNVIHRDVKPENLLLTDDWRLKIADFGWSVHEPSSK